MALGRMDGRSAMRLMAVATLLASGLAATSARAQQLPPVPVPPENPITEAKRVLGKILFWDEQMSTDGTMACATCHIPGRGGAEPRRTRPFQHSGIRSLEFT